MIRVGHEVSVTGSERPVHVLKIRSRPLTCRVPSVQRLQFRPIRADSCQIRAGGAAGVKTGRRPPRRGVVLTLAAAGAHWAIGTGGGAGSGHGFLRKKLRGRRVRVARAPGLTSVRGTALAGSGDMMIDG